MDCARFAGLAPSFATIGIAAPIVVVLAAVLSLVVVGSTLGGVRRAALVQP
jgi:hypothetical protein